MTATILFQIPAIQNRAAKITINYVSEQINVPISFDKLHFSHFNTLIIDSLQIKDRNNNNLLSSSYIYIKVRKISLKNKYFHLKEVIVKDLDFDHIKYPNDAKSNVKMMFPSKKNKTSKKNDKPIYVLADYIKVYNWEYQYKDCNYTNRNLETDFNDIDVTEFYGEFMDLTVINDSVSLKILNISLKEQAGFIINSFNSDFTISSTTLRSIGTVFHTPNSDADLDLIFNYRNFQGYSHFTDSVEIIGTVRDGSNINLIDISRFTSTLAGADNLFDLEAEVRGPVNHMDITNIDLHYKDKTYYAGDVFLRNVDTKDMELGLNIEKFTTDYNNITQINVPVFQKNVDTPYHLVLPDIIKQLGFINLNGNFFGKFDDFSTQADIKTDLGNIIADIDYNKIDEKYNNFNVKLNGSKIEIGKLLDITSHISTIDASINFNSVAEKFIPQQYTADGVVTKIKLPEATINDLTFDISNDGEVLNSAIQVFNENIILQFNLNHLFDLTRPITNISIDFNHVNFNKLGLLSSTSQYSAAGFINADINGLNLDSLNAQINVSNLTIKRNGYTNNIGNIFVNQEFADSTKTVSVIAEPLKVNINGDFVYEELPYIINNIAAYLVPSKYTSENSQAIKSKNLHIDIDVLQPETFTKLLSDNITINDNIDISLDMNNLRDLTFSLKTNNISFNETKLSNIDIFSKLDSTKLSNNLHINHLSLSDEITQSEFIDFSNLSLFNEAYRDTAFFRLAWVDTSYNTDSKISMLVNFKNYPDILLNFPEDTYISLQKNKYKITSAKDIVYNPDYLALNNLKIESDSTFLIADGYYSKNFDDSIQAYFSNLNIAPVNLFTPKDIKLNGIIDGNIKLQKTNNNPYIVADIAIDDLLFNDKMIGDMSFNSEWNNETKGININTHIYKAVSNFVDTVISLTATYYPFTSDGDINGKLGVYNFDISLINPLINNFANNLRGSVSGNLSIQNTLKSPVLQGSIDFKQTSLAINFTGAKYNFSNSVDFYSDHISFDAFKVYDNYGKSFDLSGSIYHNNWKDLVLSLNTKFEDFIFLDNMQPTLEQVVYGKTYLSGTAALQGSLEDMKINANVTTGAATEINIAISSNKTASQHSFIHFNEGKSSADSITNNNKANKVKDNFYTISAKANINPNTQLNIYLPYSFGEMNINGSGEISYTQKKDGTYSVLGDYYVTAGNFNVNFQSIVGRDFTIKEGGSLIFNGDPMNATMNLQAIYQLRASLEGIPTITDQSIMEQRIPINCIINFSGVLANPTISFDLELPNVDKDIQDLVFAAFDMNDQTEVSQQVFSLLVFKSFNFSSNNTSLSSGIGASSLSFISSQISSWLSMISNNLDLGVNYNPGNEVTPEEWEIVMKTELFNNRLIIDGNIGVQNYNSQTTQTASNIVGDVIIEYKITQDGKLRVKAFNRSNEFNVLEEHAPYTQGIGLSYYTEFNKFSDIFSKKRKVNNGQ